MSKLYSIGDVHGCAHSLSNLLSDIPLQSADRIVFLGDYVDRGPDSRGVVDQILDLRSRGFEVTTLMGNHELMFMEAEKDPDDAEFWEESCGGMETLVSFGVSRFSDLPDHYQEFFQSLPCHALMDEHIFVHAGLDFSGMDIFQNTYAMLWSRRTDVDLKKLGRKRILHGHTPQSIRSVEQQLKTLNTNRILNIDTGCVFPHIEGLGYLTAYEVTEGRLFHVPNSELR